MHWRHYGFLQEIQHFTDCIANDTQLLETGEDGKKVLEIVLAAYGRAGTGRRIDWPSEPPRDQTPIELWLA